MCHLCHSRPNIGWVYVCTQDAERERELSLTLDAPLAHKVHDTDQRGNNDLVEHGVSDWILKAIKDGHYTAEQIEIITKQKEHVKETIAACHQSSLVEDTQTTATTSSGRTDTLPAIEENPAASTSPTIRITDGERTDQSKELASPSQEQLLPQCRWLSCHTCRPTYRDRSWQSLNGILSGSAKVHAGGTFCSRKVTDANIVRTLGLRRSRSKPTRDKTTNVQSEDDDANSDPQVQSRSIYEESTDSLTPNGQALNSSSLEWRSNPQVQSRSIYEDSTDSLASNEEALNSSSLGWRRSLKRAWRGMLLNTRRHSYSSRSSRNSRKKHATEDEDESEEAGVGVLKEISNQVLREAIQVRLPRHDGMIASKAEDEENKEVEVDGGVAVTEESVDLGTADIIMQV